MPRLKVALRMPPPENASPIKLSLAGAACVTPRASRDLSICSSSSVKTRVKVPEVGLFFFTADGFAAMGAALLDIRTLAPPQSLEQRKVAQPVWKYGEQPEQI